MILTKRRQRQAIRDFMSDIPPEIDPANLVDPYDYLWKVVQEAKDEGKDVAQYLTIKGKEETDLPPEVSAILSLEPGYRSEHKSLAEIGPDLPTPSWLWKNWVLRGLVTLVAAWPGVGKTYFILDLARLVISGARAPDGAEFHNLKTGHVIYVDAEDFLPDIYQRAKVWRMDMTKFFPIRRPPRDLLDYANRDHQDDLFDMCYDLKPDLVIVDSLSSVNSKGENNIEDLREVLGFFSEIPQIFDCAFTLVHHLRKPGKGPVQPLTMHDLRGTGHLTAMARSIIGMDLLRLNALDDPNGPRLIKVLKTNRGKYPFPLSVEFSTSIEDPDTAELTYSKIDLFSPGAPASRAEECAEWLFDLLLEQGPLPYHEIMEQAGGEGFNRYMVNKARGLLGKKIADTIGPKVKGNSWVLAEEAEEMAEIVATPPAKTEECAEWLVHVLQSGPLGYSHLVDLAAEQGYSENILLGARNQLGSDIAYTKGSRRAGNQWVLANRHPEVNAHVDMSLSPIMSNVFPGSIVGGS
jgi:hypothetical protein